MQSSTVEEVGSIPNFDNDDNSASVLFLESPTQPCQALISQDVSSVNHRIRIVFRNGRSMYRTIRKACDRLDQIVLVSRYRVNARKCTVNVRDRGTLGYRNIESLCQILTDYFKFNPQPCECKVRGRDQQARGSTRVLDRSAMDGGHGSRLFPEANKSGGKKQSIGKSPMPRSSIRRAQTPRHEDRRSFTLVLTSFIASLSGNTG